MKYWSSALPLFLLRHETATAFSVVSKIVTPTKSSTTRVFAESSSYSPLDGEQRINLKQDLESPKVATQDEVVGGDKKVYCRCWMSGTFPLCDGQHMKHNKATGDNVGPLIVSVPKATTKVAEPNFVMAKSSEDAKEEEEKGKPKKHVTRKKIAGRKKRVILGYRLTSVAYLASTIAILAVMGVRGSSVYFGSGHVLAAGLGYILASAAENDRLDSDTYKRLNLCLTDYGLVGLGMVAVATEFRQSPIFIIPALIAAINSVKGYAYGVLGWDKSGDVTLIKDFAEGTKSTLQGLVSVPKNLKAAGYLAATGMVMGMAISKLAELYKLTQEGAGGSTIAIGLGRFARLELLGTLLYTLKDAADRDRLEGTTFIQLNFLSSVAFAAMSAYLGVMSRLGGAAAFFSTFSALSGVKSILKKRQKA